MKIKKFSIMIGITFLFLLLGCYRIDAMESTNKNKRTNKDYFNIGVKLMREESLGFLKLGISDKTIIKNLGVADEKLDAVVWGAGGEEHQTWFYKQIGIEFDLIREEKVQVVNMITIKSPCKFKTRRNIGIGSKKVDVLTCYRYEINPENTCNESVVAGSLYGGIIFGIENGYVKSIFIGASSE